MFGAVSAGANFCDLTAPIFVGLIGYSMSGAVSASE
jgi:hypothetical protein